MSRRSSLNIFQVSRRIVGQCNMQADRVLRTGLLQKSVLEVFQYSWSPGWLQKSVLEVFQYSRSLAAEVGVRSLPVFRVARTAAEVC